MKYFALVVSLAVASCGAGGGEPSDGSVYQSPGEQCESFMTTYCTRVADCLDPTDHASNISACRAQVGQAFDCSKVRSVSSGYTGCLQAIPTEVCTQIVVKGADGSPSLVIPQLCSGILMSTN